MCSESRDSRPWSLASRLTLWYAGAFAIALSVAFLLVYLLTLSIARERTDEDLVEDLAEFRSFMEKGGMDRVRSEMVLETAGEEAESAYFRLWSRDGNQVASTDLSAWTGLAGPDVSLARAFADGEPAVTSIELPRREHAVRVGYTMLSPGLVLELGQSLEEEAELVGAFVPGFLLVLAAVLLLAAPVGWFMARRALRSVEAITAAAMEIADGSLDRRVPAQTGGEELDRLARTFNLMVERIQTLIAGMREMTDTLAHDLRSPLARIRASAEMGLVGAGSDEDWRSMASDTVAETDRMLEMINSTLDIVEAESGAAHLHRDELDLAEIVAAAADLFQTVADDRRVSLSVNLPQRCYMRGDRYRLQRVVANLLDNALKYTPKGGSVRITLTDADDRVELAIVDNGTGISQEDIARIFERFYRCDRSRTQPGNGLGLSLALAFVRLHGGTIEVESVPGHGSTFTVVLPRAREG